MQILERDDGFTVVSGSVSFDFMSNVLPKQNNHSFELDVVGSAPVPVIIKGDRLLLPIDEGVAITAEKEYDSGELDCNCIGGEFCSRQGTMSMVIVERRGQYLLIALESGINAQYLAKREGGLYHLEIICRKKCKISYGVFSTLTEACKYYRSTRNREIISLFDKIKKNPEIEKLVGGGIFWIWNNDYDNVMYSDYDTDISPVVGRDLLTVADELYQSGVDKALFGLFFNGDSPSSEELYNKYGYLSTQYDNYNDVLNPELLNIIPQNRVKNCDYTRRRMVDYPEGILIDKEGNLCKAWALRGYDGEYHAQNTLCPLIAAQRIKEEIPRILEEYPYYKGRFIDVYGGGISECHSKEHPLTREECLSVKNDAFEFLGDIGLIAGTEDGFEDLINGLVYTEGLHSPVYFRNKDSGRKHANMYDPQRAEHIRKYMLNPECRVPLWHLVYHECMLAFPYWGDSTECSPEQIKKKILYAVLYGCPPLYSFFVKDFAYLKDSILFSYEKISKVHQKIATLPMSNFEILTDDYRIQKSVFGNQYEIVANFSDKNYEYHQTIIEPDDFYFGTCTQMEAP